MNHLTRSLATGLTALALGACTATSRPPAVAQAPAPPPTPQAPATVTLTDADNARAITLAPGDTLHLALAENPTTGYRWAMGVAADAAILPATGDAYTADPAPDSVVGRGGTRHLRFVARQPGATRLEVGYGRPWERGTAPARTFQLAVQVREK